MKRLVLAGGGHAHVHVLDRLARSRPEGVDITLLSPFERQVYSGMLPGWIAGIYPLDACMLPLTGLAERAGVRFVRKSCVKLEADARVLECDDGEHLEFDLLSLDVGSVTAAEPIPGADHHAIRARPIEDFITAVSDLLERVRVGRSDSIVIVGDGAAAVEIAFALDVRLRRMACRDESGRGVRLGIAGSAPRPLSRLPRLMQWRVASLLRKRNIAWYGSARATGVAADHVRLSDGRTVAATDVLQLTGASAHPWLSRSGLATDRNGFVQVLPNLQSSSHSGVFAVGDCAAYAAVRPKSGVFAVRAGPPLAHNLIASLKGDELRAWTPQRRALYLLSTGDGDALAAWGAFAWWGEWVWRWKDRIDRAFVARYGAGPR
ncbi:FAD-dependent oxidoreductase [Rhodocyclaceae bacterium SMB388]